MHDSVKNKDQRAADQQGRPRQSQGKWRNDDVVVKPASADVGLSDGDLSWRQQLAELEHLYRSAPVGLCLLDTDLRFVRINDRLAQMNGRTVEEHIGRSLRDIIPDVAETVEPLYRRVLETGESQLDVEIHVKNPRVPDEDMACLLSYYPVRSDDGCIQGISTVVQNITERKRAEDLLRESEERFRALTETTRVIAWEADARTFQFTYVGDKAEKILGYPASDWYNESFWAEHIHSEDRDRAVNFCVDQMKVRDDYQFDYRMIAADGSVVWLHDVVNVIRDEAGAKIIRGFMIDITELRVAEEQSRQLLAQLSHVSRVNTLGEMVTGLAHELNQPLTAIGNYAYSGRNVLASLPLEQRERLQEYCDNISAQAFRAGQIIRRLRGLVRKEVSETSHVDVNQLVREVFDLIEFDARSSKVLIKCHWADAVPLVIADPIQIQQVVLNLIKNAIEACAESGAEPRQVTVETSHEGPMIQISVSDTGGGLSTENLEQMFEAFHTTKAEGMGLGLTISRSIVDAHGGRLWATANSHGGATFQFCLPVAKPCGDKNDG